MKKITLDKALESEKFKRRATSLLIPIGFDEKRKFYYLDLWEEPHILISGMVNSGKEMFRNCVIDSLMKQNRSDELKFILIDPKRVYFSNFKNSPYLAYPILEDVNESIKALEWCVYEMERGYSLLAQKGHIDLRVYNNKEKEKLPYIVVVISELADLMVSQKKKVEDLIIRLVQMGRAVGIQLIICSQRPSKDVLTEAMCAHFCNKAIFQTMTKRDSRWLVGTTDVYDLSEKGQMYFKSLMFPKYAGKVLRSFHINVK